MGDKILATVKVKIHDLGKVASQLLEEGIVFHVSYAGDGQYLFEITGF
jgi:hypothetical protein